MGSRKIRFSPIKEGSLFSTVYTTEKFDSIEIDLNRIDHEGLSPHTIAEGALNYQHLNHPGPSDATNYGSPLTFSESHMAAARGDMWDGIQGHGFYYRLPASDEDLEFSGPGWSFETREPLSDGTAHYYHGVIIGRAGSDIDGSSPDHFSGPPRSHDLGYDLQGHNPGNSIASIALFDGLKIGSAFRESLTPDFVSGVLFL
jgi:hypothetical protein